MAQMTTDSKLRRSTTLFYQLGRRPTNTSTGNLFLLSCDVFHLVFVCLCLVILVALALSFSCMSFEMSPQMVCLNRRIVILVAFVRLSSRVSFQMSLPSVWPRTCRAALVHWYIREVEPPPRNSRIQINYNCQCPPQVVPGVWISERLGFHYSAIPR